MLRFRRFASTYEQAKILRKYPVGATIHGYEIRRVLPVPELSLTAVDLVHNQTGSEHLHIDRNDNNNVFSIAFKTNPPNATGVPHILEHTTLCGSNKYPVHDPFFKMLNKSLANFMNAMTGPDYTFFPFATTNLKDFENLRDVYLDSTLNPLLQREDFYQEGWRLEYSDLNDNKSDITFKGVVYNEMKGQVSNADYYFWSKFQQSIYPSLNNSGGDPKKITSLMYEDLVDFHRINYHPSNSRTFTYGNFPLNDSLKRLNKEFLVFGKRSGRDGRKLFPVELKQDVTVNEIGQIDPMLPPEKQIKSSMTWVCGTPENTYDTFLLKVLGNLLMDGQSSIMYKKLIESGLGFEFSVNSGAEPTTSVNFFTIGVQGVEDVDTFRTTVNEVFDEVLNTPFDKTKIEGIIQQIELSKKDQKPDFGLQILYALLPGWTNKLDPFESLTFDETLNRFKEDLKTKGDQIFYDIINKYIHKKPSFNFTMTGSPEFSKELESEEKQRLQKKIDNLDEQDKKIIYDRGLLLNEKQNKVEDLSCLPSLKIDDIARNGQEYPVSLKDKIMLRLTDTNGISYIRGKKSLNNEIPLELYPYLPLYVDSLTSLGTSDEPFSEIENKIKLYTGGISTNIGVSSDPISLKAKLTFGFSGWSLNSKTDKIFEFWEKLLLRTDFVKNQENLKVLIRMLASSNTSAVSDSGHVFARGYATAHFSVTNAINESLGGIQQLQLIMKLSKILDDPEKFQTEVIDKLMQLHEIIIRQNTKDMKYFVTTDTPEQFTKIQNEIGSFQSNFNNESSDISTSGINTNDFPLISGKKPTLLNFPFQNHHTALSKPTNIPFVHKDSAALQILASVLSSKHLHKEIRERNGAYGAGAKYDAMNGSFNYFSYRDPNALESLSIYNKTFEIKSEDLNDGKLRLFQDIDSPVSRRGEGTWNFEYGVDDKMRQERRERLLDVTIDDVDNVMGKYLTDKAGYEVVVGPPIANMTVAPEWDIKNIDG